MNESGSLYPTNMRGGKLDIPDRPTQYTENPRYNYRVTTIPNVVIGRHYGVPERMNNDGTMQPPGVPIDMLGKKGDVMRNIAGFTKPSYTVY
jgi:hypothetical protein